MSNLKGSLLAAGVSVTIAFPSSGHQFNGDWLRSTSFGRASSNNVAPRLETPTLVYGPFIAPDSSPMPDRSEAQQLFDVHQLSGLTWDQIARYFGVSRRAVHLWVSGGRMSAANAELLADLVAAVRRVSLLDPGARRQALLNSESGLNLVDSQRARRSSRLTDINRSPEIGYEVE